VKFGGEFGYLNKATYRTVCPLSGILGFIGSRPINGLVLEMIKQTAIFANGQNATWLLHGGLIKML
jgi:hypothetical protein